MDLDSDDILKEVDELLSKLDKLPDDVRLQALKKLSQKVSAPRLRGGRGGRGRGRGNSRCTGLPLLTDTQVGVFKKEAKDSTEIDKPGTQNQVQENISARIKEEVEKVSVNEEKTKTVKEGGTAPKDVIVSGRRHTKKVDYRQLAEYGHGNEDQEDEIEQVSPETKHHATFRAKRGRGRPRKHPPYNRLTPLSSTDFECTSSLASGTKTEEKCTATMTQSVHSSSGTKDTSEISGEEQGNGFDLLESCLKESGIKGGDAERCGKKINEQQVKVEESEPKTEGLDKEEHEENERKNEAQSIYVCDTLEDVDKVPRKRSMKSQHKCEECGKMYSTLSILKTHQIRHRNKEDLPFRCEKCNFTAASKIELFRHSYKHTDAQLYICEICGNTFSRDTSLREHIEYVHAKTRRMKCALCNFVTHRRTTIRNHLLTHEGTQPVIACPVCGVTFRSKRNLRAHLFSHAGAKPFACEDCGKKFIMRNRLSAHKLQVHGPRTHRCPHCVKCFPTIHHLRRHIRIHTGEKPYKCCFCSFSCNTQGNLIKHIRQVHDRLDFTYKDFLRESGREEPEPEVDYKDYEKMSKEGKELAQRLLPTLGEWTGQTLTVEQLRDQVRKEKDTKVAAMQEQQARRKRRVLRKASGNVKPSTYYTETDGKITLYTLAGSTEDSTPVDTPMDEQISVETGLSGLGDNQYLLTHTDDNGCVMIIPWDVSLIGESEEGEEEGEWTQQTLQGEKIVKCNTANDDADTVKVAKDEIDMPSIVPDDNISRLETPLEINSAIKQEKCSTESTDTQVSDDMIQVRDLSDVVDDLDPLDVKETVKSGENANVLPNKSIHKHLPESIQVIASNEPVDDTVPNASNFVLPEGYIVDDSGQVIHLTENVIDTNLLLRQMGQVVRGTETPEVTINKITSNVYSLMSQGSDGQEGETFVITTQEGEEEEENASPHSTGGVEDQLSRVDLLPTEEEDERQSALVLIVNAEDLDKS